MQTLSDETLNFWADVYQRLDKRYGLYLTHKLTFEQFLQNPEQNERWIHIFMANAYLFKHRPGGVAVLLSAFLDVGPEYVLLAVLVREQSSQDKSLDYLPPLEKQLLCRIKMAQTDPNYLQDCYESVFWKYKDRQLEMHGDQVIQPIHHRAAPKKYKTGGKSYA